MSPADSSKLQKIRLQRIGFAAITYLFIILVVYFIHWSGIDTIAPGVWVAFILVALLGNLLFVTLLLTNWNLKLLDPSMTRLQIIYSALWGIVGVIALPNARPLVLMLYLPSFMFGSLRLTRREYLELTATISVILAGGITFEYWYVRPDMNIAYEVVLWICFTLVLTWLALFGSYVYGTKRRLRDSLIRLESTEKALREASVNLTQAANTDYLTGTLNRRAFYHEIDLAKNASNENLIVILLDIDHFKAINDQHGHDVGDLVLIETVKRIKVNLRPEDLLSRWGGEEFLILLKHLDLDAALNVAERIRQAFTEHPISVAQLPISISLSQGIATIDNTAELPAAIRLADERLYQAKQSGRNRVVWQ